MAGTTQDSAHDWVKGRRYRTAECAVIALAGDLTRPKLVVGVRYDDAELRHLGRLGVVMCHPQA
jgi:hypothetical protein